MITDNRIFSRNFAVYGRLPWDTARKRAVFCRNPGHRNTAPYLSHHDFRLERALKSKLKFIRKTFNKKNILYIHFDQLSIQGSYIYHCPSWRRIKQMNSRYTMYIRRWRKIIFSHSFLLSLSYCLSGETNTLIHPYISCLTLTHP